MSYTSLFLSLTYQRSSLLLLLLMIVMFVDKAQKILQINMLLCRTEKYKVGAKVIVVLHCEF